MEESNPKFMRYAAIVSDVIFKKALLGNLMLASSYNSIRIFSAYVANVTLVRCKHESN